MKRKIIFAVLIIICLIELVLIIKIGHDEKTSTGEVKVSYEQVQKDSDSVQDGPYVFWIGNRAVVQYVCDSHKVSRQFEIKESMEIAGSCEDSSLTYQISPNSPSSDPDTYIGATRICAVSDIHGNLDRLIDLLKGNGVIDNNLQWDWRDGHLVVVGDIFDRKAEVTEALWFIHQLEQEARKQGGWVHFILGNHEVMVLRGNCKYVNEKYTELVSKELEIKVQDLYGPDTELGRWLRSKNVIIKINDLLFVHGGISPELINHGYTIQTVNDTIRNFLDVRDHVIHFDEGLRFLFGYEGPLWYRGYIKNWKGIPMAKEDQVRSVLDYYGASTIVVGHTIVERVTSLYGGRVYAIETGIYEGAEGEALVWEQGIFYRADVHGKREILN